MYLWVASEFHTQAQQSVWLYCTLYYQSDSK